MRCHYSGHVTSNDQREVSIPTAHPELSDGDPVYDDPLPGVHGGAGPRPAAPRVPDTRGHAVLSVPGALTRHTLHTAHAVFTHSLKLKMLAELAM